MGSTPGQDVLDKLVGTAYDCAAVPARWPEFLQVLAHTFHSSFADVFSRTDDRKEFRGMAFGLDEADYQDLFLKTWVPRNVWSARRPVQVAGEIVTTREILSPRELQRTEMYHDYLGPRGLHEGLRLSLWAGNGWVQFVSLLRPWSAGPFEGAELDCARALLPHLQRAAAIARRLQETASLVSTAVDALDTVRHAIFILDGQGQLLRTNGLADSLLDDGDALLASAQGLTTAEPALADALGRLIARALGQVSRPATSNELRIPRRPGQLPLAVMAVPVPVENSWLTLHAPAVLVMACVPSPRSLPSAAHLASRFGLTRAEADLAASLAAGHSLADIARSSGRGLTTVRSHLARLMDKTGARRQAALVQLLLQHNMG